MKSVSSIKFNDLLIVIALFKVLSVTCFSLMDHTSDDTLDMLADWDSSLYGKPICRSIPSNMSLCNNINYKKMRVPNLLGHDVIDEIEYQSSAWSPLLSISCHKETQLFLCSLFAPVCVEQSPSTAIYPCRSLCESVKSSCEGPMLKYSYPWPEIFNCSKFPEDNGLCIKSSENTVEETTMPSTTLTTTTTTSTTTTTEITSKQNPKMLIKNQQCNGCDEIDADMLKIVRGYCKSDLVFRGRIQSIKISNLRLSKFGFQQRELRNRSGQYAFMSKPMASLYVRIGKRDRKILKGHDLMTMKSIGEYLSENGSPKKVFRQSITNNNKDLDVFIMSKYHLNLAGSLNKLKTRSPIYNNNEQSSPKKRFSDVMSDSTQNVKHCMCDSLKRNPMRFKTKYFIMANILKTKMLSIQQSEEDPIDQDELEGGEHANGSENLSYSKRYLLDYFSKKWTREVKEQYRAKRRTQGRIEKIVYLSYLVKWNKARPFIDYLEDDTLTKDDICLNIKKTVVEINKAHERLF